jgi:hypothetical protein
MSASMKTRSRPGMMTNPQPFDREAYLGDYQDTHSEPAEPYTKLIQGYARDGLSKTGHHGKVDAMGVPRTELPDWDDIQILTAQLARPPLLDDDEVETGVVIGPECAKAAAA